MLKSSFAALAALVSFSAFAASPDASVVGPEAVADWFSAGNTHIANQSKISNRTGTAKNVILFIGDGMGISTVTAARIRAGELANLKGPERNSLSWEVFPNLALSKTYQYDQQTPDSAPTAAAMHTGYKSRDGMISVSHTISRGECLQANTDKNALKTIGEYAAEAGKSVGIVTTARVTHATPSVVYAHTSDRNFEALTAYSAFGSSGSTNNCSATASLNVQDIADQLVNNRNTALKKQLKVALGGGRFMFLPTTVTDPEYSSLKGKRTDGRDLTTEWTADAVRSKAKYVWNQAGFDAATAADTDYLLGLFEPGHAEFSSDRTTLDGAGEPSLTEMTQRAIAILKKNNKGFFLQVEAGRIDHAHHLGNAARALADTVELSNAVQAALGLVDLKDTLIIVTADHSHTFTMGGYSHRGNPVLGLVEQVPTNDGAAPVKDSDANGLPFTTLGYYNGPGAYLTKTGSLFSTSTDSAGHSAQGTVVGFPRQFGNVTGTDTKSLRNTFSQATVTDLNFLQEAVVPLSSETHGGEDVGIWATGPYSHYVRGSMEQNWIFHVMAKAFGFTKFTAPQQ
jgi:alkaline phosphatase